MYCRPFSVRLRRGARHAQRGQAIAETVIILPVFLLALFGMVWVVKLAVQSERVQNAIRYSWTISERGNLYGSFSFYSMYSELGSTSVPAVTCTPPLIDPLSDAAPTYTSTQATTVSPPFFSPYLSPKPDCLYSDYLLHWGSRGYDGSAQDVLVTVQEPTIASSVDVPIALTSTIGSKSSTGSSAFVYQQSGLNGILACYLGMNTLVNASLDIASDGSNATMPTKIVYATMKSQTEYQLDYFNPNATPCGYVREP